MTGKIKSLVKDKGFGFILGEDNKEYFFHHTALVNIEFDGLERGQDVTFESGKGSKGPLAEAVEVGCRMSDLNIESLIKLIEELQPPWAKYRGTVHLQITDWLDDKTPILQFESIVLVQKQAYRIIRSMDWGPFGPPNDNELAAIICHMIDERNKKEEIVKPLKSLIDGIPILLNPSKVSDT